jgi:4-hydroxybenzoate polyprenyltransferase
MAAPASRIAQWNWLLAIRLFHPIPSLVTTLVAMGFGLLFRMSPATPRLWILGLAMLMAQLSISAANEWADRQRDQAAGRWRPVSLGMIAPTAALAIAVACGLIAVGLALALSPPAAALAALGIGIGWVYDLAAKPTPFSVLPFALAFPLLPVWVGVVAGYFPRSVSVVFLAGAPVAAAIHLADAIPDADSDTAAGSRTLAVAVGVHRARVLAASALLLGGLLFAVSDPRLWWLLVGIALAGGLLYLLLLNRWVLIGSAAAIALAWFL